jgi:hypothetical protein
MVVDNPDDRWREVAARLIADTELFERRFDRDFFGGLGPRKPVGAYVLEAMRATPNDRCLLCVSSSRQSGRYDAGCGHLPECVRGW